MATPAGRTGTGKGASSGDEDKDDASAKAAFALVPARASTAAIDYSTSEGIKLFNTATASLYKSGDDRFDCEADGLPDFLQLVEDRSSMLGYDAIFSIPEDVEDPKSRTRNFLKNHGALKLTQVQDHAEDYVKTETRMAQESAQLYYCLMNSLSPAGRAKISIWASRYTISGVTAGVPLLKVIIMESDIDTQATAVYIRQQLSSLDDHMKKVDSDIAKFNQHVRTLIRDLRRRRESSTDVLTNLFKGYKAASDKVFVEYIERKEEMYEEGEKLTVDALMHLAANKYKSRLRKNEWNAPSQEETKILALEAKIKTLEGRQRKRKADSNDSTTDKKRSKDTPTKLGTPRPAWMTVPPTKTEMGKPKTVKGKEYWWCVPRKVWARHHPKDCKLQTPKLPNEDKRKKDARRLKFDAAMEAIANTNSDNDTSNSSE